mmetsp:Transcript_62540/g.204076  ORF Transcript_62540/g.204076 Transcript_62540/m.204076 type:complete len:286 (+) Transcript_62540:1964-2821(+)
MFPQLPLLMQMLSRMMTARTATAAVIATERRRLSPTCWTGTVPSSAPSLPAPPAMARVLRVVRRRRAEEPQAGRGVGAPWPLLVVEAVVGLAMTTAARHTGPRLRSCSPDHRRGRMTRTLLEGRSLKRGALMVGQAHGSGTVVGRSRRRGGTGRMIKTVGGENIVLRQPALEAAAVAKAAEAKAAMAKAAAPSTAPLETGRPLEIGRRPLSHTGRRHCRRTPGTAPGPGPGLSRRARPWGLAKARLQCTRRPRSASDHKEEVVSSLRHRHRRHCRLRVRAAAAEA